MKLLEIDDLNYLKVAHNQWVNVALKQSNKRDSKWTQSIVVGDRIRNRVGPNFTS